MMEDCNDNGTPWYECGRRLYEESVWMMMMMGGWEEVWPSWMRSDGNFYLTPAIHCTPIEIDYKA